MNIILSLFEKFYHQNINYCVFKEYDLIQKTIDGTEDIDILVNSKHESEAIQLMKEVGYQMCIWLNQKTVYHFILHTIMHMGNLSLIHC